MMIIIWGRLSDNILEAVSDHSNDDGDRGWYDVDYQNRGDDVEIVKDSRLNRQGILLKNGDIIQNEEKIDAIVSSDSSWLVLIDSDRCLLMLIVADWYWLLLIDAD